MAAVAATLILNFSDGYMYQREKGTVTGILVSIAPVTYIAFYETIIWMLKRSSESRMGGVETPEKVVSEVGVERVMVEPSLGEETSVPSLATIPHQINGHKEYPQTFVPSKLLTKGKKT